jgi:hypothetical protein
MTWDSYPSSAWLPDDVPTDFELWLDTLRQDVIEDEYGYEPGEFTVYPEHWRALFDEHLTPRQAFDRALSAFARDRE